MLLYGVTHNGLELESPIPGWRYAVQPAIAGSRQPICAYKKRQPVLTRPSFYLAIRSLPSSQTRKNQWKYIATIGIMVTKSPIFSLWSTNYSVVVFISFGLITIATKPLTIYEIMKSKEKALH